MKKTFTYRNYQGKEFNLACCDHDTMLSKIKASADGGYKMPKHAGYVRLTTTEVAGFLLQFYAHAFRITYTDNDYSSYQIRGRIRFDNKDRPSKNISITRHGDHRECLRWQSAHGDKSYNLARDVLALIAGITPQDAYRETAKQDATTP